jgi:hypothetical protein
LGQVFRAPPTTGRRPPPAVNVTAASAAAAASSVAAFRGGGESYGGGEHRNGKRSGGKRGVGDAGERRGGERGGGECGDGLPWRRLTAATFLGGGERGRSSEMTTNLFAILRITSILKHPCSQRFVERVRAVRRITCETLSRKFSRDSTLLSPSPSHFI